MKTWLILDCNYLAHRAYHSLGELSHGGIRTGTVFGFFQAITDLQDLFGTEDVLFCFDSKYSYRQEVYTNYKITRRQEQAAWTPEEMRDKGEFYEQVANLRRTYLKAIGFANVYQAYGYESDDIMAGLCNSLPETDEKIIVTADKDLYQCLRPDVTCYNPHTGHRATLATFTAQWGLVPDQWVDVKALAGCATDDIAGLDGIGEITAAKYLNRTLGAHTKKYKKLETPKAQRLWQQNISLIQLPYPGCPTFETAPDEVTWEKWEAFTDTLGFKSLRAYPPISGRANRRQGCQSQVRGESLSDC